MQNEGGTAQGAGRTPRSSSRIRAQGNASSGTDEPEQVASTAKNQKKKLPKEKSSDAEGPIGGAVSGRTVSFEGLDDERTGTSNGDLATRSTADPIHGTGRTSTGNEEPQQSEIAKSLQELSADCSTLASFLTTPLPVDNHRTDQTAGLQYTPVPPALHDQNQ